MAHIRRVRVVNQQIIDVAASRAWEWLTDWAGTKRTGRPGTAGELALAKISLIGDPEKTPRTREMEFGALGLVRETLLHQDDELRHLFYNIEGVGPYGIRNYLATTDVDDLSESSCQITITARFDAPEGCDLLKAQALISQAHNEAVIGSIVRYSAAIS